MKVKVKFMILEKLIILIIGINKTISTSKIKKIIAIRKNWRENGIRALFLGSNPHSKGEFFSLSWKVFFDVKLIIAKRIIKIIDTKNVILIDEKIIYTKFRFFDWKSTIIIILCKYLPHQ